MRRFALLGCAALLCACGEGQPPQTESTADSAAEAAPAASMISLADLAGTWTLRVMPENSDSVLVTAVITATGDTSGWTMTFPGRDPIPLHVMPPEGDSLVVHAGPYDSALRPGTQVSTEMVVRLQNGMLVGLTTAHYAGGGPDSVVVVRTEATRNQ